MDARFTHFTVSQINRCETLAKRHWSDTTLEKEDFRIYPDNQPRSPETAAIFIYRCGFPFEEGLFMTS